MTTTEEDRERNKNFEEAFKYKMEEMTKKGRINQRNWSKATAKSTGQNVRPGHQSLIENIAQCNKKILKTKRGLSIFEDHSIKDQINEPAKIPILKDQLLKAKLNKMIITTEKVSGYETVTQRTKEEREKKLTRAKAEAQAKRLHESIGSNEQPGAARQSVKRNPFTHTTGGNSHEDLCEIESVEK